MFFFVPVFSFSAVLNAGWDVNSLNSWSELFISWGIVSGYKHRNYGGPWTCCLITSLDYLDSFRSVQIVGIYQSSL